MARLTDEEKEIIKAYPICEGLDQLRLEFSLKSAYVRSSTTSNIFEDVINFVDKKKDAQILTVHLLIALYALPAAFVLPSRNRHSRDTLSADLLNITSRIVARQFDAETAAYLFEQVIIRKPDEDERIWSAVYDLVAEPKSASSPMLNKAVLDTPFTPIASSQKGAQQILKNLNRHIEEIGGCDCEYTEGKPWPDRGNDISRDASKGQVDGHRSSYRKHYIPLESNPDLFTKLIHKLGVSSSLAFEDVLSIDDPDLLAFIPRPAFALILVFPTSNVYEEETAKEDATNEDYSGRGEEEDVMWFKQTINNACGLYGILHAVSNGEARNFIQPDSSLANLFASCLPLAPDDRALALEASEELESAHAEAAMQGDSSVPNSAEDEVDFHYVCFVKSHKNGRLYQMDGDRKGPIDRGPLLSSDEDILAEGGLSVVREFIRRENSGNLKFSLLALVCS
ncbi:MAG: ubiquitinyl hydrolase 1 [Trichoglossum hirsutum]|nr:MAG: ubiquitinyl hydrolase 1 [Trichoglossum hirsutum]